MNTLSLAYQLSNHVVDEFSQFLGVCINSDFVHKTFYNSQLQTGKLQFCIKYKYFTLITTL